MQSRTEGLKKASDDYSQIDGQIVAAKLFVQNKILGIEDADMVGVVAAGGGYLAEIRDRFLDDPVLMAGYVLNRPSQRDSEEDEWRRILVQLERYLQVQPLCGMSYGLGEIHP